MHALSRVLHLRRGGGGGTHLPETNTAAAESASANSPSTVARSLPTSKTRNGAEADDDDAALRHTTNQP